MQGRARWWLMLLLLAPAGCQGPPESPEPPPSVVEELGKSFDPATTGAIQGRIVWRGDLPSIAPFQVFAYLDYIIAKRIRGEQANPHVPAIEAESRGVGQVAILLRHLPPGRAKEWDHPPAQVVLRSRSMAVAQGAVAQGATSQLIGFVPRGGEIGCVNQGVEYHSLRARGAAFFTLPLVETGHVTRRRLDQPGLVELSCGNGHFWMRAYLFVLEHPYAVLSARDGSFALKDVPEGDYQLVAWLPNWHVASSEHDPETGLISRVAFAAPGELEQSVTVRAGQVTQATFEMSQEIFDAKKSKRETAKRASE